MKHARKVVRVMAAVVGLIAITGASEPPPSKDSKDDVQKFVRAYIEASNNADPTALMDLVSKKSEVSTIEMGVVTRGFEEIRAAVDKLTGTQGTHRISLGSMDVTFLGPGYALVVTPVTIDLTVGENQAQIRGAMTMVLEKSSGKWKMFHEHDSLQFPMGDAPGGPTE